MHQQGGTQTPPPRDAIGSGTADAGRINTWRRHIAEEYKYRRANRQIFVGVLPAAALGGSAATISMIAHHGWGWLAAGIVFVPTFLWLLLESAFYQEVIAQALLVDVAF